MLVLDLIDRRTMWRDYWMEWVVAAVLLTIDDWLQWRVAAGAGAAVPFWQVLPAFPGTPLYEHWMDVLAPLGVGGIWLASYLWLLKRRPLLPAHDPEEQSAALLHEHNLREGSQHG